MFIREEVHHHQLANPASNYGFAHELTKEIDMENRDWNLGRYVIVRPRQDGTHCVLFSVPDRLRPSGWPATIRLPEIGRQSGSLEDPKFKVRVEVDAQRLNDRLDLRRRREALSAAPERTLPRLAEIYFKRDRFTQLSASRQYRNRRSVMKILEWSESRGHPDVATLTAMDVDDFLARYARASATRFDMRSVWNVVFQAAVYAGWVKESPMPKGNWETPNPKQVAVWTPGEVKRYSEMAVQMEQPGLAALIVTMMEIGQRLGDMRAVKWDQQFFGDRFVIKQSKGGKVVNIPIPVGLRKLLESIRRTDSPYVFNDADTKTGFTSGRLRERFNEVRHALSKQGEPLLHLRGLRHACVCRLMEAGLPTAEIAGITGHLLARVHTILERYYPDRWGLAESGMRRAHAAGGHDPEEFGVVRAMAALDWAGDRTMMARYSKPTFTEQNVESLLAAITGQHRLRHQVVPLDECHDFHPDGQRVLEEA